jgi:hypothetical protein
MAACEGVPGRGPLHGCDDLGTVDVMHTAMPVLMRLRCKAIHHTYHTYISRTALPALMLNHMYPVSSILAMQVKARQPEQSAASNDAEQRCCEQ